MIVWDTETTDGDRVLTGNPAGDGAYLIEQPVVQHNGAIGNGFKIGFPQNNADAAVGPSILPADNPTIIDIEMDAGKDMVTALPGTITYIKAKFDKPGRYVWYVASWFFVLGDVEHWISFLNLFLF